MALEQGSEDATGVADSNTRATWTDERGDPLADKGLPQSRALGDLLDQRATVLKALTDDEQIARTHSITRIGM